MMNMEEEGRGPCSVGFAPLPLSPPSPAVGYNGLAVEILNLDVSARVVSNRAILTELSWVGEPGSG